MKTGRELDVWIYKNIIGGKTRKTTSHVWKGGSEWDEVTEWAWVKGEGMFEIPHYSADVAMALEALDKFADYELRREDGLIYCAVSDAGASDWQGEWTDKTIAMAICGAIYRTKVK